VAGKKSSSKKPSKSDEKVESAVSEKKPAPSKAEPKKEKAAPPRAIPSQGVTELVTAKALVTKNKYVINRWWKLQKGQDFTAPRVVIDVFRKAGFVE